MPRVRDGWRLVLGGALFAWCLLAATSALQEALARGADPIAALDAEFGALAFELPARGVVGYLERYEDAGTEAAIRMHYAAQYALVPRVVVSRIGPEFLIVARGTQHPEGDPRLDGYYLLATFPSAHRVYRRLVP